MEEDGVEGILHFVRDSARDPADRGEPVRRAQFVTDFAFAPSGRADGR